MRFIFSALLIALAFFSQDVWACDKPYSVFQNGPKAIIAMRYKLGMGQELSADDAALLARYEADEAQYWEFRVKSDPVCSLVKDQHGCVSECSNRPKNIVDHATFHEGNMRYSLPPEQRVELERKEKALEVEWEHMEYVK